MLWQPAPDHEVREMRRCIAFAFFIVIDARSSDERHGRSETLGLCLALRPHVTASVPNSVHQRASWTNSSRSPMARTRLAGCPGSSSGNNRAGAECPVRRRRVPEKYWAMTAASRLPRPVAGAGLRFEAGKVRRAGDDDLAGGIDVPRRRPTGKPASGWRRKSGPAAPIPWSGGAYRRVAR